MNISKQGLELIKKYEGVSLKAYKDIIGVWTIGYGNTHYINGDPVKLDQTITQQQADELLSETVKGYEIGISKSLKVTINQNQFDSIVSLAYNCGLTTIQKSTLLKKVNANPNDHSIADEFKKWNKAGGKVSTGLANRRESEVQHYYK